MKNNQLTEEQRRLQVAFAYLLYWGVCIIGKKQPSVEDFIKRWNEAQEAYSKPRAPLSESPAPNNPEEKTQQ